MKYLVNRKTKEHKIDRCPEALPAEDWYRIQADEGWITHTGDVCPLPEDVRCEVKFADGGAGGNLKAGRYGWTGEPEYANISHYRPILAEKVQEPEPAKPKRLFDDLLERLEASHNAAQALPDLVAQLRDRLKPLGLGVMYLSEFDAVEPEAAVEPSQDNKYAAEW